MFRYRHYRGVPLMVAIAATLLALVGCGASQQRCETTSAGIACVMEARP
jgi:hypothetical protein